MAQDVSQSVGGEPTANDDPDAGYESFGSPKMRGVTLTNAGFAESTGGW